MIPIRLTLRNFMCYGENVPPLDFSGIHVACLIGDNGHGKSALLDAMTWALWGRARASRDDSLVRQGALDMEVTLEFSLAEQRYRVVRRRALGKRGGQTDLQFQAWTGSEYQTWTEPTIRGTERRLLSLLRLDYETFVNSAFLVQGEADRFTTQQPGKRKEILAEILGLSRYDVYEKLAKEQARKHAQRVLQLEAEMAEAEREISHEPLYREQQREVERRVAELEPQVQSAEAVRRGVSERVRVLEEREKEIQLLDQRLKALRQSLVALERRIQEKAVRLESLQKLVIRRAGIEAGMRALREAQERLRSLSQQAEQRRQLENEGHRLEARIREAQHHLEIEAKVQQDRLGALHAQAWTGAEWQGKLTQLQARVQELEAMADQQKAVQAEREVLNSEKAVCQRDLQRLEDELTALRKRLSMLKDTTEPHCPLCQQELTEEHRSRLVEEITAEGLAKKEAKEAQDGRLREIEGQLKALGGELNQFGRDLAGLAMVQRELATAEQHWQQAQEAEQEATKLQESLNHVLARLNAGDFAAEERAALSHLEESLHALAYDPDELARVQQRVDETASFEGENARLRAAEEQVGSLQNDLAQDRQGHQDQQNQVAAEEARQQELTQELAGLDALREELHRLELALEKLRNALAEARSEVGAARQRVAHCEKLRTLNVQRKGEKEKAAGEQALYEDLQQALGKRGVQAMLIDQALPEIMDEANRLLARMTDGRMRVELNTQRSTQAGGTIETLDITIGDELGNRPYELYSGGEAFRINFALRVALARLLARRAGARLQTLIIDEGFGTQDATGRERLVEAINSISPDFDRILVVTHVEELKDLFPVRIEVTKTEQGSSFVIR